MSNPGMVVSAVARQLGVPVNLALALMRQESGGNARAVGDNGTSFGLFQLHQGGELGSHSAAWAYNPWNNARTALGTLARTPHQGLSLGAWAAAAQRPANPGAYASSINSLLGGGSLNAGTFDGSHRASVRPPNAMGGMGQGSGMGRRRAGLIQALSNFSTTGSITGSTLKPTGFSMLSQAEAFRPPVSRATGNLPGMQARGPATGAMSKAITFAHAAIGTPYQWGGESSKGYDCSGLIQAAFRAAGINIPRTTYDQIKVGRRVSWGSFRPGDLIFSNFEGGKSATHVVLYVGNGKVIAAPHTGTTVQYENVNVFKNYFVGARRVA